MMIGNILILALAILKAVAQKLIPGIPIPTRISILQQTDADKAAAGEGSVSSSSVSTAKLSVLEQVIDNATSRNEIQREIDGMKQPCVSFKGIN
jgi:hypothetical protein